MATAFNVYELQELPGVEEFLELASPHGVAEVVRVSADTIYVFLRRELWPEEVRHVRRLAEGCWALDRIVLAVRADLRGSGESKRTG